MALSISANELKTRGISILSENTEEDEEVIITVRGKSRYVVIPIEKYNHLRECELEAALNESRNDIKSGRYHSETVEEHIKRITSD